jgi:hypothetical protein
MFNTLDIEASSSNICADQDVNVAFDKHIQSFFSLFLISIAKIV